MSQILQKAGKGKVLLALGLVALTLLAYSSVIKDAGFIWDDDLYVTGNSTLRSLDGLHRIWFHPGSNPQYYPLVHTVFWVEYHLWKLNPLGYHLVNIFLHIISTLLLGVLLERLKVKPAFLVAAIFSVHPVHVESVAWVTELKNVLSGMFYFLSAIMYFKIFPLEQDLIPAKKGVRLMIRAPRWRYYVLSIFFFACALFSKTVTCSLPAILILIWWWKKERISLAKILSLVPFFLMGAAAGMFTGWMEEKFVGAHGGEWSFTFIERCLIAGRALWFYASKLICPYELTFTYPRWQIDAGAWWQYLFPVAAALVILGLWLARGKIGRGPLVAVLFFCISLFPALGFFNVYPMRYSFVADHFQYLASLGLIVLFCTGLNKLLLQRGEAGRWQEYALYAVVVFVLAGLTWNQGKIYKNPLTLFDDTILKNPSSWMAYNNRGSEYFARREYERAFADFNEAIRLYPEYPEAHNNRGLVYEFGSRYDLAMADFQKAIKFDPRHPDPYGNLGWVYLLMDRDKEAEENLNKALRIHPKYIHGYIRRGILYGTQKRYELAIADFNRALAINPEALDAYIGRGFTYLSQDKYDLALADFNRAIQLDSQQALAYYNRSLTYEKQGQYGQALADALKARSLGQRVEDNYIQRLQALSSTCPLPSKSKGEKS